MGGYRFQLCNHTFDGVRRNIRCLSLVDLFGIPFMEAPKQGGYLFAGLAAFLFGTSPIFTRWATETLSSSEIAFGRLFVGGLTVLAVALWRREPLRFGKSPALYGFLGLTICIHFLTYVAAIRLTTLAHALTLVYASVIFIALISRLTLKEAISRKQWLGIGIALIGLALLTGFEPNMTKSMLLGDLLALGSALTFAIYSVAGRHQKERTGLFAYAGTIYLLGSACTLPFAAFTFSPQGYTLKAIVSVVGAGLIPMGIGHTLYNAALRRLSATVVNLLAMQEVLIAVVAGALLFSEQPSGNTVAGVVLTIVGIVLVVR